MPAGPVGTSWQPGSHSNTAWEAGVWGDAPSPGPFLADRVKETTSTTGISTLTLLGAVVGFRSFGVFNDGDSVYYFIVSQIQGQWESGIGLVGGSGTTLQRLSVFSSSNGDALVNFSAGLKDVFSDRPSAAGVTAGPLTSIASVTVRGGMVTAISGS